MTFLRPKLPKITRAEFRLRQALENAKIRFLTQEVIICSNRKQYCVDFLLMEKPIVIEVDGWSHDTESQRRKDEIKTQNLQNEGYTLLRFRDEEVWHNLKTVMKTIKKSLKRKLMRPSKDSPIIAHLVSTKHSKTSSLIILQCGLRKRMQ